jgi:YbbR domain-containing protein
MPNNIRINPVLLNNTYWFMASLGLSFFVWIIASTQADPVQEYDFRESIPIQITNLTDGLMVVEQGKETVAVTVRAQQSVLDDLESDDIIVTADLDDLGAGTHIVELEAKASRRASIDTQPRQMTVILEEIRTQQVRVELDITQSPLRGYEYGEPLFSESQVTVSGAISQVQQVVAARARLDLSAQRDSLEEDVRLVAVDAEGNAVRDVEISPQNIVVSLPISRRADVREVAVYPDVVGSLADGYDLTSFSYEPQTIFVVGEENALELLPDTLPTDIISLEGRTEDFEVNVPVVFPGASLPLLGDQVITVTIHIIAQETTTQFEAIPVQMVGLSDDNLSVEVIPAQVRVFINGPQSILEILNAEDISVVLDLNGYTPGTYTIAPQVSSTDGQIQSDNINVVEEITVTIDSIGFKGFR